jgi:hypothetical protein
MKETPFWTLFLAPTNLVTAAFSFIATESVPGSAFGEMIRFPLASFFDAHLKSLLVFSEVVVSSCYCTVI